MLKPMKVKHYPLSKAARMIVLSSLIINIFMILLIAYFYHGAPNSGLKATLLILPAIFITIFVIFLLILRFRYTLLEKYPYLINLPSFVYRLGMEKDPVMQGKIISRISLFTPLRSSTSPY